MLKIGRRSLAASAAALALSPATSHAQKKYGPGASDSEIKLGQNMPYSGPASSYSIIGKVEFAYFKVLNEKGGINGRRINLISLDDGYSPPKALEVVRRLVEDDQVLALVSTFGTPTNSAIQKYANNKRVPHILVQSGASKWNDPKNYPWTTGHTPPYDVEAKIFAKYLLSTRPGAKIAVFYQNDDFGKDYLLGMKQGLGDRAASMIVKEASYEATDPTVDSQIIALKASGADTFFNVAQNKFAAQAIRKISDLDWKPLHLLASTAYSIEATLRPAGLANCVGIITAYQYKTPGDPEWNADAGMLDYLAFMKANVPDGNPGDVSAVIGYTTAQLAAIILANCGNELTRENVLKQATNLKDVSLPMNLPGIQHNTSSTDYTLYRQRQMARFDGTTWARFGPLIDAEGTARG